MYLKIFLGFFFIGLSQNVLANKTPSDVYRQTQQIVLEINQLRSHEGVNETPRIPSVQVYKTPLHVFAKSLEVLQKLAKYQTANNIPFLSPNSIPLRKITPSDVYTQTETVLAEIYKIHESKNVSASEQQALLVDGKTPSNVYENLWKASFMLDALVKKITPTDVYNNMLRANAEINDVARQMDVSVSSELPVTHKRTKPSQVMLQGYLNLHHIAALEKQLGLKPFRVPSYPKGKLTASDVFDSVSMLRAEVTRIKIHLKLKDDVVWPSDVKRKKPADVLSVMLMAEKNINILNKQ